MDDQSRLELATEIVAAYVSNNSVPAEALPGLIGSVFTAIKTLGAPAPVAVEPKQIEPFLPVKKSVTDDYLISLFDGRKFKSLKRHLLAEHGMTPDEYRAAFGLAKDYPMVAPAYAKQRSDLAKTFGLGRKSASAAVN